MSWEISLPGGDGVPVPDARTLAFMRDSGMTVSLEEAELHNLRRAIHEAAAAGDRAIEMLRSIVGPEPAGPSQVLLRYLLMGRGWHMAARDSILALFHAREKRRRERRKKKMTDGV